MKTSADPRARWLASIQPKIIAPQDLALKASQLREKQALVTINGSFDLLHAGHLYMLYEASLQGDVLIVGLNSDLSIQTYKSPQRPIIPLQHRIEHLCALSFVDYVSWFDETTPLEFISKVKPSVHVNGAEYTENCLEKPLLDTLNTRLHLIERAPGTYLATSSIIKKIESSICD